jgi:FixJ family two-component response regulator
MAQTTRGTVFVVDDDPQLLKALSRMLSAEGFGVETYSDPAEFLARHDSQLQGCLILDLGFADLTGFDILKTLQETAPQRQVIILTGCDEVNMAVRAMKQGAVDYLTKPVNSAELFEAVDKAIARDTAVRTRHLNLARYHACLQTLTRREREVLHFVLLGKLNKQIAFEIGTSIKTVKVHRARVMQKMGIRSVAQLVHILLLLNRNAPTAREVGSGATLSTI